MSVSALDTTSTIETVVKIISRARRMKIGTDCAMREVAGVLKSRYPAFFMVLQIGGDSGFTTGHGVGQVILDKLSTRQDQFFAIMGDKSSVLERQSNAPLVSQFNAIYGARYFESLALATVLISTMIMRHDV